ncbi:MAG: hypothetical protein EBU46_00070 [Nitrosomonadaceae bacterium]|nr:hypothetical protein [Nitrosomonadaceae bacterium]
MTLKEYAAAINEAALKYPDALVISSSDDEGNDYRPVYYEPTPGHYNDREWTSEENLKDINEERENNGEEPLELNSVCIN